MSDKNALGKIFKIWFNPLRFKSSVLLGNNQKYYDLWDFFVIIEIVYFMHANHNIYF